MATAETGTGAHLGAEGEEARTAPSRGTHFIAEIFDGADEALAALDVIEKDIVSTGFQTPDWLTVLYEELAASYHALPRLVVVTDGEIGEVVLALPLAVTKEGSLRIASFADFGVSDYGAPMLGRDPMTDNRRIRGVWRSVRAAMRDIDLIRFERMPAEIGGRPNPLLNLFRSAPSRATGHRLTLPGSFEEYLQSLGKKYRKDLERCHRLWEKEENPRLYRATTMDEIAHVFATLEEQQAVWHASHGTKDILAHPPSRAFYERMAIDGADAGLTELFALEASGEIVAALFGLVHDGTFTLLRISTGGEKWSNLSPGRLAVIEVMKHLAARGILHFDMGVNFNPLKHGFGTEEIPLYDLVAARDIAALPAILVHELVGQLRVGRRLRSVFKKAMPDLG